MLIFIIRHGETDYNVKSKLQGWIDNPLNQNGIDLAIITGSALRNTHFDLAISSPLIRAYDTAKYILEYSNNFNTPIITDDRLKEISFGAWEGLSCSKDHYELPEPGFDIFFKDPFSMKPFPEGENVSMVCIRTGLFLRELIHNEELRDKTILLSMHGCSMRAILNSIYDDKRDFWHGRVPFNCAVNIVEYKNNMLKLIGEDLIYYDRALCIDRYHA